MSNFQQNIAKYAKKQKIETQTLGKKCRQTYKSNQKLDFSVKKKTQDIHYKHVYRSKGNHDQRNIEMYHQIEMIDKDIQLIKKREKGKERKIQQLKFLNLLKCHSGRLQMTEEEISKPEDRSIDIMHANEQREKKKL